MRRSELVLQYAEDNFNSHVAQIWEDLCREYVSGTVIDGIPYRIAHRWQGQIVIDEAKKETKKVELDVAAESFDGKHILIGECKWTGKEDASREIHRLESIASKLPFIKKQALHFCLFLKEKPFNETSDMRILYPEDVLRQL